MARSVPFPVLLLTMLGFVAGQNGCGNCLHLDSGAVLGIVTCDVVITVLIAGLAFWVSHKVQKKRYEDKLQQRDEAENNHTYAHLQGQQTDIYTDIKSFNKS